MKFLEDLEIKIFYNGKKLSRKFWRYYKKTHTLVVKKSHCTIDVYSGSTNTLDFLLVVDEWSIVNVDAGIKIEAADNCTLRSLVRETEAKTGPYCTFIGPFRSIDCGDRCIVKNPGSNLPYINAGNDCILYVGNKTRIRTGKNNTLVTSTFLNGEKLQRTYILPPNIKIACRNTSNGENEEYPFVILDEYHRVYIDGEKVDISINDMKEISKKMDNYEDPKEKIVTI